MSSRALPRALVLGLIVLAAGASRVRAQAPAGRRAARAPKWSPDGRQVRYQAGVYPGAADAEANRKIAAERKEARSKVRIFDTFPIRRWDKWLDDTQTHLFVVPVEAVEGPS